MVTTVRNWLRTPEEVREPTYNRKAVFGKLSGHVAELEQALKADALRPKKDRRTARALFAQIKASGYVGGYTRVTDYIRAWRADAGKDIKAFVLMCWTSPRWACTWPMSRSSSRCCTDWWMATTPEGVVKLGTHTGVALAAVLAR